MLPRIGNDNWYRLDAGLSGQTGRASSLNPCLPFGLNTVGLLVFGITEAA